MAACGTRQVPDAAADAVETEEPACCVAVGVALGREAALVGVAEDWTTCWALAAVGLGVFVGCPCAGVLVGVLLGLTLFVPLFCSGVAVAVTVGGRGVAVGVLVGGRSVAVGVAVLGLVILKLAELFANVPRSFDSVCNPDTFMNKL